MGNIYVNGQLIQTTVFPEQIEKVYRSKYGAYIKLIDYYPEPGGSSGIILNKGADYKEVILKEKLSHLILEKIFDKINEIRSKNSLKELTRNIKLDEIAKAETNNRFKEALKFHHTFPPNEFEIPNDSFPNGTSGIGNYAFQCGNNSSVIEIDRSLIRKLSKNINAWRITDVTEISNKIVEDFWLNSKEHRQNILNSYTSTGLAITAANYRFKDFYFDDVGKRHLLNSRHTRKNPFGTLLFITQLFSIYDEP